MSVQSTGNHNEVTNDIDLLYDKYNTQNMIGINKKQNLILNQVLPMLCKIN